MEYKLGLESLHGEVVKGIHHSDEGMNGTWAIEFESGKLLEIEYDWIYDVRVKNPTTKPEKG